MPGAVRRGGTSDASRAVNHLADAFTGALQRRPQANDKPHLLVGRSSVLADWKISGTSNKESGLMGQKAVSTAGKSFSLHCNIASNCEGRVHMRLVLEGRQTIEDLLNRL